MDSLDEYIKEFFSAAVSALKQEDKFLKEYFSGCEKEFGFYKNWYQGIRILFETTMVYLILRELLKTRFPLEVKWEEKYPNTKQNADLLLKHGEIKAYIEFTTWDFDNILKKSANKKFENDIKKLKGLPEASRGFVFLIWFDDDLEKGTKTLEQLQYKYSCLFLIKDDSFGTRFRADKQLKNGKIILALLEVKRDKNRNALSR